MSVWPKILPSTPSLSGREGDLISVSINVDPRYLESLLEALAQVSFPINPQIYHDAQFRCLFAAIPTVLRYFQFAGLQFGFLPR